MPQLIKPNGIAMVSAPFYTEGPFFVKALGLGAGALTLEMVTVITAGGITQAGPCKNPVDNSTLAVTSSTTYPCFTMCAASPLIGVPIGGWYRVVLSAAVPLATADVSYELSTVDQVKALPSCGDCSAVLPPSPATTIYCPSFKLDVCGCGEIGYGYRDNTLRDPAATVAILDCNAVAVAYIYPTQGVTGSVRHEIPYYDTGQVTILGYSANTSTCASGSSQAPSTLV